MNELQKNIPRKGKLQGIPQYLKIKEHVQCQLETGTRKKGEYFGSIEGISREFNVSRLTARRAIQPFIDDGILTSRRAKGLIVNRDCEEPPRMTLRVDWSEHLKISDHSEMKILMNERTTECPWDTSKFTSIPRAFQHMLRVHGKNGRPYGIIDAYFDARLYDLSPRQFEVSTVLIAIEKLQPKLIGNASQKITIKKADSTMAERLSIPTDDPVAIVRRIVSDKDNNLVYIGTIVYSGNRIEIDVAMDMGKEETREQ